MWAGARVLRSVVCALVAGLFATPACAEHYVLNGTSAALSIYDNGQLVCSLQPGEDCNFPSPPGSHQIQIQRPDGRSISTTVSPRSEDDYDQLLMNTICPEDFGIQEPGVPACGY